MFYEVVNGTAVELSATTTKSGKVQGYTLLVDSVEYAIKPLRGQTLIQKTVLGEVKRLLSLAKGKQALNWLNAQILGSSLWAASKPERKARTSDDVMRSYERTNKFAEDESRRYTLGAKRQGKGGTKINRGLEIYLNNK